MADHQQPPPGYSIHRIQGGDAEPTFGWTKGRLGSSVMPRQALRRIPPEQRAETFEAAMELAWWDHDSSLALAHEEARHA